MSDIIRKFNNFKSYNDRLNEEVNDMDIGFDLTNALNKIPKDPEDPIYIKIREIAKQGNLYKYLVTGQRNLTFGMLKALHRDALEFKKNRELRQGIQKFLWRFIPLVLAPIFIPIAILSQALGSARAFNKVMVQIHKMDNGKYDTFLMNMLNKVFEFTEGEIERLSVDDWFYKSFAIEKGLINMVRKEHIIDFSFYMVKKIQHQDDLAVVPPYYIENEFRKYLNRRFRFEPPLPLKVKIVKHEKF